MTDLNSTLYKLAQDNTIPNFPLILKGWCHNIVILFHISSNKIHFFGDGSLQTYINKWILFINEKNKMIITHNLIFLVENNMCYKLLNDSIVFCFSNLKPKSYSSTIYLSISTLLGVAKSYPDHPQRADDPQDQNRDHLRNRYRNHHYHPLRHLQNLPAPQ